MKTQLKMFRKFWGSWPEWFGLVDGGTIVYVRIRHGDVWIGEGATEQEASERAELIRTGVNDYVGVSEALDGLTELQGKHYYFVPQRKA
jgi:hypothetical protein